MSAPTNAIALKAALPHAVQACTAWLEERFRPLMENYGAIDAVAFLSKATTGDAYCFPVAATDDGIICASRSTAELAGPGSHVWLGYGRVSGDRTRLELIDPTPFHGWGEHTALIAEIMRSAHVRIE